MGSQQGEDGDGVTLNAATASVERAMAIIKGNLTKNAIDAENALWRIVCNACERRGMSDPSASQRFPGAMGSSQDS